MKQLFATLLMMLFASTVSASQVGVYCMMAAEGTEVYSDNNIRLKIVLTTDGTALLEISNLTSKIIYVDRGRSFSWVNGMSRPLDISPFYENRLQAIAPHGTTPIYVWEHLPLLLNPDMIYIGKPSEWFSKRCKGKFLDTGRKFTKGTKRRYTRNRTPLLLGADIQYSFKELGEPETRATVSDYVETIRIDSRNYVSKYGRLQQTNMFSKPCFAFRSGKSTGTILGECISVAAVAGVVLICTAATPDEPEFDW